MNRNSWKQIGRDLSLTQITILIFAASFLIYAVSPQGKPTFFDLRHGAEITRVALTLVQQGDFAHPYFALPTGPTAHTAPGYVFLFALVAKVFGIGWTGAAVLWALNLGFLALQLALLPALSNRLGLGTAPGVMAAAFGVVVQPYRVMLEWEALFTGALMVVLCVVTLPYFKEPRDWQHSLLLGFLWGAAILTNPECVLLLFAWSHIAAMENSPEMLSRARRAMVVVVAGAALVCLPWFIRNYRQFHAVFFIRDNFGLEFATSNNPCARPTMLENFNSGCHDQTHPNNNATIAAEVAAEGEIRFNHDRFRKAIAWIESNPTAFASLTIRRFLKFWFPSLYALRYAIPMGILTILSLAGLAMLYRNHRRAAFLFSSTLFLYPLIHYVLQFEARYRYPIFWATLLPAAYAVLDILRRLRRVTQPHPGTIEEESELVSITSPGSQEAADSFPAVRR
jgi:hypothetical protein